MVVKSKKYYWLKNRNKIIFFICAVYWHSVWYYEQQSRFLSRGQSFDTDLLCLSSFMKAMNMA